MTDKELRKLGRTELLEMLLRQTKEVERLQELLDEANAKLESKELIMDEVGSIAEASLEVHGIFASAQKAADLYLENVRRMTEKQECDLERAEQESKEKVEKMTREAEIYCKNLEDATQLKCEKMKKEAEIEAKIYWNEVSVKMNEYLKQHEELKKLFSTVNFKE